MLSNSSEARFGLRSLLQSHLGIYQVFVGRERGSRSWQICNASLNCFLRTALEQCLVNEGVFLLLRRWYLLAIAAGPDPFPRRGGHSLTQVVVRQGVIAISVLVPPSAMGVSSSTTCRCSPRIPRLMASPWSSPFESGAVVVPRGRPLGPLKP